MYEYCKEYSIKLSQKSMKQRETELNIRKNMDY